jgi:hypothetical protein
MNVGAVGSSMMFLCFLALAAIVALCLLAYIARCVLVVVEGTAAGADRVHWPSEQYIDWITQSLALIGLAVFLLFPAGILAAALRLPTVYLIGPVLWLLFPIGVLSSLTAEMRWVFFRPIIVARMIQALPFTLLYYLCSALVVGLLIGPWYVGIFVFGSLPVVLVAAVLSAAMVLLYAKLLGLLARKLAELGPLQETAPARRSRKGHADLLDSATVPDHIPVPKPKAEFQEFADPARVPQSPTGMLDVENLAPYEVAKDTTPPEPRKSDPGPKRLRPLDPEEIEAQNPYAMAEPLPPNPVLTTDMFLAQVPRSYSELRSAEESPAALPTVVGVIAFPFYETSLVALLWLAVGFGVLGMLVVELTQSVPG